MNITDAMLYEAAEGAAERFLSTLPERRACGHDFSCAFEEAMRPLLARPRRRRGWKWVVAAAAALVLSLSLALSVSGEFRAWVIELFALEEVEQVPPPPVQETVPGAPARAADITRYAVQDIGEVFDVEYLVSDKYLDTMGPLFYCREDGVTTFCEVVDGAFVPVPSQRVQQEVTVQGVTATLDYTWCEYEGKIYFQQEAECELPSPDGAGYSFYLALADVGIEVIFYHGRQSEVWEYRVLLDPRTGETTDFLAGVTVDGRPLREVPYISSWEKVDAYTYTVRMRMAREPLEWEAYLVNLQTGTAVPFRKLCGLEQPISSVKYIDGKYFLFSQNWEDLTFDYYRYDPVDGSCTQLYDGAVYWNADNSSLSGDMVSFSGGRYHFLKTGGALYLVDEVTGGRMTVEGLTERMADSALTDHTTGERLLVSRFGEDGIGKLGILDIPARRLYLLERQNTPGVKEYAIGWHDGAVQICAHDADWQTHYIYRYRLKE